MRPLGVLFGVRSTSRLPISFQVRSRPLASTPPHTQCDPALLRLSSSSHISDLWNMQQPFLPLGVQPCSSLFGKHSSPAFYKAGSFSPLGISLQMAPSPSPSGLSQPSVGRFSPACLLLQTLLLCCLHNLWLYIYSFAYLILCLFLDKT